MLEKQKAPPALKEYGIEADQHWAEVMDLAEQYGFILQAYAGTAVLATHRSQLEELGEPEYLRIQQMNGHCPKDFGLSDCLTPEGAEKECGSCWATGGAKWVRFERSAQYQPQKDKG